MYEIQINTPKCSCIVFKLLMFYLLKRKLFHLLFQPIQATYNKYIFSFEQFKFTSMAILHFPNFDETVKTNSRRHTFFLPSQCPQNFLVFFQCKKPGELFSFSLYFKSFVSLRQNKRKIAIVT